MRIPLDSCNISEELNRSGVWQGINKENKQGRRDDVDENGRREDRKHRGLVGCPVMVMGDSDG